MDVCPVSMGFLKEGQCSLRRGRLYTVKVRYRVAQSPFLGGYCIDNGHWRRVILHRVKSCRVLVVLR